MSWNFITIFALLTCILENFIAMISSRLHYDMLALRSPST